MYYATSYTSPVGVITLACDENGSKLTGLWIEGQKYHGNTMYEFMTPSIHMPIFEVTKKWLDKYFSGENPKISELPLAPTGSDFRQRVWNILCEIPYGTLITYGEIAQKIATEMNKESMSSRAVGNAVGHNPISIIIPCHRVVGSKGSLTGYSAGVKIKAKLLELERVSMSQLSIPKKGTAI